MANWYTREEAEPSPEFGKVPEQRNAEELLEKGIIIVDKPFGPTSNQVTNWIKEELNLKKAGHFGTLDPNATGVLPVGLNKGTRVQEALAKAKKEYIYEAELGEKKDREEIEEAVKGFEGTNKQVPPEKSAVKREEREREVYESELLETKDNKVLGRVKCESGFYVRVMIRQLGEKLGCDAEMTELRRTEQGDLTEDETNTLQEIVDGYHFYQNEKAELNEVVYPIEKAVNHLKKIVIKDSAVNAIANGADLGCTGISKLQGSIKEDEQVAIMTLKGELVALAEAEMTSQEMYDADGKAAELQTVHMDPKTYPKRWGNQ